MRVLEEGDSIILYCERPSEVCNLIPFLEANSEVENLENAVYRIKPKERLKEESQIIELKDLLKGIKKSICLRCEEVIKGALNHYISKYFGRGARID